MVLGGLGLLAALPRIYSVRLSLGAARDDAEPHDEEKSPREGQPACCLPGGCA